MMDVPMAEPVDDHLCTLWLDQSLPPEVRLPALWARQIAPAPRPGERSDLLVTGLRGVLDRVHTPALDLAVATDEAMRHATRVTPSLTRHMGVGDPAAHPNYT